MQISTAGAFKKARDDSQALFSTAGEFVVDKIASPVWSNNHSSLSTLQASLHNAKVSRESRWH